MLHIRTINYAMPPEKYFWRWSETFDALEFYDGDTCAMWAEVQPILNYLADESGLPPLGSVILLISACRDDFWSRFDGLHTWILDRPDFDSGKAVNELAGALKTVRSLPEDLRNSLPAKCGLITAVFEGSLQGISIRDSKFTVTDMIAMGPERLRWSQSDLTREARFHRDIQGIIKGLENYTLESLENRLRTGLESIELNEVLVPLDEAETREPATLFEALKESGEEGAMLAGIAEQAIAMVHFPGRLDQPDDLPVGGISDITNRGTVDRLLPGELAWDEMTLAVRLINGEALYYRREVPPQDSPKKNAIFLDRGLRLWGVNRLYSLGLALGISQQPQWGEQDLSIFTVDHFNRWCSIDLANLECIKKLLSELIPAPNPALSLSSWWEKSSDDINGDVVVVSIQEHIDDASCIRVLSQIAGEVGKQNSHLYVVTVDRSGQMELDIWSSGGVRPGIRAKIDLDDLFEATPKGSATSDLITEASEPGRSYPFYHLDLPPFLFPVSPLHHRIDVPGGVVSCVGSGIFRWAEPGKGGREICYGVPESRRWLCKNGSDMILAVCGDTGDPVRAYQIFPGELKPLTIGRSRHSFPREIQVDGGALILGYLDYVEAFSLDTGARVIGEMIEILPKNPVFHFDGEKVEVLAGNPKTSRDETWLTYDRWEEMIVPESVAWTASGIWLQDGGHAYRMDLTKAIWESHRRPGGKTEYIDFVDESFDGFSGISFKVARLDHIEILYDSRGMIHVNHRQDPSWDPVSFLLLKGQASIWSNDSGLLTKNEKLLPPGLAFASDAVLLNLKKRFDRVSP